jgi:hypothetical protein
MPPALYRRHDPAGRARYQELKQLARSQRRILAGAPGTLKQRTQSGNQYWVREHIRADGRKSDEYIGPAATTPAATITRLRAEIELGRALAAGSAALRLHGYQRIDRKPAAVLEVLYNRGLFQAGLALVGSHAYGALLNELGIIAAGYRTQDIDLARARPLAIAHADASSLEALLKETGLGFVPVPGMPSRKPSASFKLPGAETLAVDLLVPGQRTGELVAVKELGAHAQAIPLLDFLIEDALIAAVLSPNQVIPVSVPSPERFALHKLFSSQSRGSHDRDKAGKDLGQAAVLAAAIEEETPGALAATFRAMPRAGKGAVKRASRAASRLLDAHSEAKEVLLKIAGR